MTDALQRVLESRASRTYCAGCGRRYADGITCYSMDPTRQRPDYARMWCERVGYHFSDGTVDVEPHARVRDRWSPE